MIPRQTVDLILDTARIEDVVGDFVTLKRRGANFVACCPFHNEKTPSFYVSPSKGLFKCFGCGKAGSAVGFVMEHEHCSYTEGLHYLARKYNIDVREEDETPEEIMARQRRESVLLASEFGQKFFVSQLDTPEGQAVAMAYYRSRGLEDETIAKFGLGWAPSGRTALLDAARAAGFKDEFILAAGLAVQREDGTLADKFHERVMFPIHTVSGRVVAFSGRTLRSDNPAKYVNTADTEIYSKSRNLLGIFFAKGEISRQGKCILVEGNVDMVTMHQLGIGNVVASCGTSLTIEQIRLIHKFTDNVTIMYDGDSAGIHAALRGINLVLEEGLNVKIILLPDGDDPDSFCRKHTLEEVQDYIAGGERDFIEFKTDLLLGEAGSDPLKKANLINDIADTIADIPDPVKRSVYVEATAARFGIESEILFGRISDRRQKKLTDLQTAQFREKARAVRQSDPVAEDRRPETRTETLHEWTVENRNLEVAETDLLQFVLKNGTDQIEFETDSEFYSGSEEDKPTAADFIRNSLETNGFQLVNSALRQTYDAYFELYDQGLDNDTILRGLYNSENRTVAQVAADLTNFRHVLSVKSFEDSLMNTGSWLARFVPKTIIFYMERILWDRMDTIRKDIAAGRGNEEENLAKLVSCQRKHNVIEKKLRENQ